MELIEKQAVIEAINRIPRIKGIGMELLIAAPDVEEMIAGLPTVPAVPLDKLCECLVRKRIGFVDEVDGKRLTATLDKALWATLIKEWMEGLDGPESMVQKT